MKCPSCNAKVNAGWDVTCSSCGYNFSFSPKSAPYLSDMAVYKRVLSMTHSGQLHFTENQLFAGLIQSAKRIQRRHCFGLLAACVLLSIVLTVCLIWRDELLVPGVVVGFLLFLALISLLYHFRRPNFGKKLRQPLKKFIQTQQTSGKSLTPTFVDGRALSGHPSRAGSMPTEEMNELMQYEPEGILIIEREDLTEALIRDRFHFDSKVLTVSSTKQPENAFRVAVSYLAQNPHLPIFILRDYSTSGQQLVSQLRADADWQLGQREIIDLGLNEHAFEEGPPLIWYSADDPPPTHAPNQGKSPTELEENLRRRYFLPADQFSPKRFTAILGYALANQVTFQAAHQAMESEVEGSSDSDFG